jgi:hypothetical protein
VQHVSTQKAPNANKYSRIDVGIGAGLAIGAGLGVALGVALDNLALGIAIDTGCDLSLGVLTRPLAAQFTKQLPQSCDKPTMNTRHLLGMLFSTRSVNFRRSRDGKHLE